jgi:hypothetical protein
MLPLIAAVSAFFAAPALPAEVSPTRYPNTAGTWKVARVECADGSEPDPSIVPAKGGFYLTVVNAGNSGIRNAYWSRWNEATACWSVGPGLLLQEVDDERAPVEFVLPGEIYAFNKLVSMRSFQVGLHCGQGDQTLLNDERNYYSRPGDKPGDFRWLDFNSNLCIPQQDATLVFEKL